MSAKPINPLNHIHGHLEIIFTDHVGIHGLQVENPWYIGFVIVSQIQHCKLYAQRQLHCRTRTRHVAL